MSLHSTILAASLLGSTYLIVPPPVLGQSSTSDTTPADTQRTQADSAWVSGVYHAADTSEQGDTTAAGNTTSAAADTILGAAADTLPTSLDTGRTVGPDTLPDTADSARDTSTVGASDTAGSDTASASAAPADSILGAACDDLAGGATVARDLLVIVFAPKTGAAERVAVAEAVEGKLLGPVMGEPGAFYLRLNTGGESHLRAAADQLIQLTPVRQVGSRACPPAPSLNRRPYPFRYLHPAHPGTRRAPGILPEWTPSSCPPAQRPAR